ncbi:MAG: hypothetical protein KKD73_14385 [Proteobacteria bacterium]|nr:hypothetical protein [Pseudomonadota bacterium]MBU1641264.1 hypothetical protein [Pseudomonadota bacterium]
MWAPLIIDFLWMADLNVSDWNVLVGDPGQAWKEFFLAKGQVGWRR